MQGWPTEGKKEEEPGYKHDTRQQDDVLEETIFNSRDSSEEKVVILKKRTKTRKAMHHRLNLILAPLHKYFLSIL